MKKGHKLFKNLTLSEKIYIYLTNEKGCTIVNSTTNKYKVLSNGTLFYFLGKSGGVQVNLKNKVGGAKSFTENIKLAIKNWERTIDNNSIINVKEY